MRARWVRWRWVGLGTVAALVAAAALWIAGRPLAAAMLRHPYFAIDQVIVRGAGPALSADEVRAWLGLAPGTTLWGAAPASLRARLEEHPFIAQAAVRREFPGRLEIVVRERQPCAIAVLDDLYYVDRRGALFGPLAPTHGRDFPFITGLDPDTPPGERSRLLRRALRVLRRSAQASAEAEAGYALGAVSEVHVDAADGVTLYPSLPRVAIVLGWGSWSVKLERAARVLTHAQQASDRVARIDTRFRNQVVTTLRARPVAAPAPTPARRRDAVPPPARGGGLQR